MTKFTNIEAAKIVEDETEINWDHDVDMVVVGFGAAGVSAALEAQENGLKVIALDRFDGGGATVLSGGVVYAGGGTKVQIQEGETDSPQAMFDYLKLETQGVVRDETLMRFCQQSPANLDWLMSHGVKFSGPVWKKKTSYPKVKYFLYHSDNSLLPNYQGVEPPAARGHRGVIRQGNSAVNLGGSIFWPMRKSAQALGVAVHTNTEVRQLVIAKTGRVLGVKALCLEAGSDAAKKHQRYDSIAKNILKFYPTMLPGGQAMRRLSKRYRAKAQQIEDTERRTLYYRARAGVVLSAGGFIFNRAMVKEYCPKYLAGMPLGTHADDGSGIELGQSAGGAIKLMHRATAWRFINPPLAWSRGMIVNQQGERYVNESSYGATLGEAMVERNEGKGWLILDSQLIKTAWQEIIPGKVLPFQWQLAVLNHLFVKKRFNTVAEMSAHFGFDVATVQRTLDDYNAAVAAGGVDEFGKAAKDAAQLHAPFHVIDVGLAQKLLPCTVLTMGGLDVNEETGQVVDSQQQPVTGLYAAGRTAVGVPSKLYMSGLSIADCVFSGRRAGQHAAQQHEPN